MELSTFHNSVSTTPTDAVLLRDNIFDVDNITPPTDHLLNETGYPLDQNDILSPGIRISEDFFIEFAQEIFKISRSRHLIEVYYSRKISFCCI